MKSAEKKHGTPCNVPLKIAVCTAVIAVLLTSVCFALPSENTPPFNYGVLANGLEVFTKENHAAPLVYIEIAVRTGGISQTPETAGLFHLYEHMMFKGNKKYPTAAAVQKALSDMGVTNWNGSTADEYVNYYITVPSSLLEEGLEFWSYAIRTPLLDESELENEKAVVLSEITGTIADPGHIFNAFVTARLFPDYPWRLDPAGNPEAVKNATVQQLKDIQQTWYVPDNAAVFVGGDIDHAQTMKLVRRIFGNWKRSTPEAAPEKLLASLPPQAAKPLPQPAFFVQANPEISDGILQVMIQYRGPDAGSCPEDTYAADVWSSLASNPSSRFAESFAANQALALPSKEYLGCGYLTKRFSGRIMFYAVLGNTEHAAQKAMLFYKQLTEQEIPAMTGDTSYFSAQEYAAVKQRLTDTDILSAETAEGFLKNVRFWWTAASAAYYQSYAERMAQVTPESVSAFLRTYIKDSAPVISVSVNPRIYAEQKDEFSSYGFSEITESAAYWYNSIK